MIIFAHGGRRNIDQTLSRYLLKAKKEDEWLEEEKGNKNFEYCPTWDEPEVEEQVLQKLLVRQ